jgi:hypothetical protein
VVLLFETGTLVSSFSHETNKMLVIINKFKIVFFILVNIKRKRLFA